MMAKRLIDADKIKYEKVCEGGWGGPPYYIAHKTTIDEMPTVDAIPVSWLEEKLKGHPELRYATTDGICEVLRLWSSRKMDGDGNGKL